VFDPDMAASRALAQRITTPTPPEDRLRSKDPEGYDLIVKAAPLGMRDGDPMSVDVDGSSSSLHSASGEGVR
jgi:shikimate dehydrogenase